MFLMRFVANPWVLLFGLWLCLLVVLSVGPIEYPGAPSLMTLAVIGTGGLLFLAGHFGGVKLAEVFPRTSHPVNAPSNRVIEKAMVVTSILGIVGIACIAFDREVLSGVNNSAYASALRCAPEFVAFIEIRRTPLIYFGYLTFSFGYASMALYLLRAEDVRGWPSYLAQASIISPVGYAMLYSGRMPVLLLLTLIAGILAARVLQGRTLLPRGQYLAVKGILLVLAFAIYTNAMWSIRQDFCNKMGPAIVELREMIAKKAKAAQESGGPARGMISADQFAAVLKNEMEEALVSAPKAGESPASHFYTILRDSWGVSPRSYVSTAIDSGTSPRKMIILLSNYFYLTHGVMTLDRIMTAPGPLGPLWGVYEIGVLSPFLRVVSPGGEFLQKMQDQLSAANIYGFFPTVWGAAIVDFGKVGAVIYILIWGGLGGWAYMLTRRTGWITPVLALAFVLASILFSPIQGPLGNANSALVLASMLATGVFVDLTSRFGRTRTGPTKPAPDEIS